MFGRILRILAISVASIPLVLEPALAAPPAINLAVPSVTQTDIVLVGKRRCTAKIRTNCLEGVSPRTQQATNEALAGLAVFGLLAAGAVIASRGNGGYYYGGGHRGGQRSGYRAGYRNSGRGGSNAGVARRCNSFYTVKNPVSGKGCY